MYINFLFQPVRADVGLVRLPLSYLYSIQCIRSQRLRFFGKYTIILVWRCNSNVHVLYLNYCEWTVWILICVHIYMYLYRPEFLMACTCYKRSYSQALYEMSTVNLWRLSHVWNSSSEVCKQLQVWSWFPISWN